MKLSICIPCYEAGGRGAEFIRYSLTRIHLQTFKDIEICVTDHSIDNEIEKVCKEFSTFPSIRLKINYHRVKENLGNPTYNTNKALINASGDLIRILHMDDYLFTEYSIEKTIRPFDNKEVAWSCTGYVHSTDRVSFFNHHIPQMVPDIHINNKIGFPSCVTFRREHLELFDENLIYYVDTDFYKRMYMKLGNPFIVNDPTVVCYLHDRQVTNTLATEELRERELRYVKAKFV